MIIVQRVTLVSQLISRELRQVAAMKTASSSRSFKILTGDEKRTSYTYVRCFEILFRGSAHCFLVLKLRFKNRVCDEQKEV